MSRGQRYAVVENKVDSRIQKARRVGPGLGGEGVGVVG